MPRNVAINSLATWMIEHPCIQETNYERNVGNNVGSVNAERVVNYNKFKLIETYFNQKYF